jgi:hypothetical protein
LASNRIRDVGINWGDAKTTQTEHAYSITGQFLNEKQMFEFSGDRQLMIDSGVKVKYGNTIINSVNINFKNPMSDIENAIKSTQGTSCPASFFVEDQTAVVYSHDFENLSCSASDLGYNLSENTVATSFCGSGAMKISTADPVNNYFNLFDDQTTKISCSDNSPNGGF